MPQFAPFFTELSAALIPLMESRPTEARRWVALCLARVSELFSDIVQGLREGTEVVDAHLGTDVEESAGSFLPFRKQESEGLFSSVALSNVFSPSAPDR
jgi:hypothetical protein